MQGLYRRTKENASRCFLLPIPTFWPNFKNEQKRKDTTRPFPPASPPSPSLASANEEKKKVLRVDRHGTIPGCEAQAKRRGTLFSFLSFFSFFLTFALISPPCPSSPPSDCYTISTLAYRMRISHAPFQGWQRLGSPFLFIFLIPSCGAQSFHSLCGSFLPFIVVFNHFIHCVVHSFRSFCCSWFRVFFSVFICLFVFACSCLFVALSPCLFVRLCLLCLRCFLCSVCLFACFVCSFCFACFVLLVFVCLFYSLAQV